MKELHVLLGEGLTNCRILFKKMLRLFELRIDISGLFHSIIIEGKKLFEKGLFKVKTGFIVGWFCDAQAGLRR